MQGHRRQRREVYVMPGVPKEVAAAVRNGIGDRGKGGGGGGEHQRT